MPRFFAALSGVVADEFNDPTAVGNFSLIPRKWEVSIWDWAEIQSEHRLHMPFTVADSLAKGCGLEIEFDSTTASNLAEVLRPIHAMLYTVNVHPFAVTFVSSHSINQYAGISNRKTKQGRDRLPEGMRSGLTTKDSAIEIWAAPYESGNRVSTPELHRKVSAATLELAIERADKWRDIKRRYRICEFLESVLIAAPHLPTFDTSLLHIWTGLEALFPKVRTEVSFRIALYLAQLAAPEGEKLELFQRARSSYNDRSRIAHGGTLKDNSVEQKWLTSWHLLSDVVGAIISRGSIPSEEALVIELLKSSDHTET